MSPQSKSAEHFFNVQPRQSQFEGVSYLLSPEDLSYWNGNPPAEIIYATASIRKALMFFLLLNNFTFSGSQTLIDVAASPNQRDQIYGKYQENQYRNLANPSASQTQLEFNDFLEQNIFNGDGSLDPGKRVLLGYWHGVPVYVERQDGETHKSFDPVEQSINKITDVAEVYQGSDVVIFSSDTVSVTETQADRERGVPPIKRGKPAHEYNFPQGGTKEQIQAFLRKYVEQYYPPHALLTHLVGYGSTRLETGKEMKIDTTTVILEGEIIESSTLIAQAHTGGGGVFQNLVDWNGDFGLIIKDEELRRLYEALPDDETRKWVLICQIAGVPWLLFRQSLDRVARGE